MKFLEVRCPLSLDDFVLNGTVDGVHEEDIEVVVAVRDKREAVALGGDRGACVIEAAVFLVVGQPARVIGRLFALRDIGPVQYFLLFLPSLGKFLDAQSDRAAESLVDAPGTLDARKNFADLLIAVLRRQVVPHRLPAAVRGVAVQLVDAREVFVDCRVAKVHIGVRVPLERFIFSQSLIEPHRELKGDVVRDNGLDRAPVKHIVNDGMHELVMNDMAKLLVISLEREDDAVLEELRYAADPLLEIFVDDVRLLEVVMRVVNDDGDALRDLVPERFADRGIGRFGDIRGKVGDVFAPLTEINVEVRGLHIEPFEFRVLDFILSEFCILSERNLGEEGEKTQKMERKEPQKTHKNLSTL